MKTLRSVIFLLFVLFFSQTNAKELYMPEHATVVVLETTLGKIEVTLRPDVAPKTCENFVGLVKKDYYNGITFHRIIQNFMIQGGDPTGTGAGGHSFWGGPFVDEFKPNVQFDRAGVLAMANRGPNTNTSQFFITTATTPWLNQKHTIFGQVTSGYEIVQKIEKVQVDANSRPLQPVKILKAYIKE